ncbi:MAG: hypothetical protein ACJAS9_003674 [Polaribacter sp.]|jgi:hypothetical protein
MLQSDITRLSSEITSLSEDSLDSSSTNENLNEADNTPLKKWRWKTHKISLKKHLSISSKGLFLVSQVNNLNP